MLLRRSLLLVFLPLAISRTGTARAAGETFSLHGGVAIATLFVPTLQLQLESRRWFFGAEWGYGLGFGNARAAFGGWGVFRRSRS